MEGDLSAAERGRYSAIIQEESIRLTRLLDDLLDLTVLESGQVELNPQSINLRDLIDRAIASAGLGDGLNIVRNRERETQILRTDSDRLVQVFINLVSNARKYCDADTPQLTISVTTLRDQVQVDFVDNGSGIAPADQRVIFEKFARLSDHSSAGSAGLGLAISREIMGRLGGSISCLEVDHGAAFRVVLPATYELKAA